MSERDGFDPGTPCWIDLASPDMDRSSEFYGGLFGWTIDPPPPEVAEKTAGYRNAMIGERPVAGIGPVMAEGQVPAWTTYIATADADATTASVREHGGQVFVEPMDVMDFGRMAVYADPTGAAFGVWQAGVHRGAGVVNEPNALCWNEVHSRDTDAAGNFYRAVFGLELEAMDMDGMEYTMLKLGDRPVGGLSGMDHLPREVPPHWLSTFAVADTDAIVAEAQRLGGGVRMEATDGPIGRFALLHDPHEAPFGVIALAQPSD